MEFYLLEDLDFNLIVYHPYRDLIDLCGIYDNVELGEEGEVGYVADKERFWGTGKGKLHIDSHRVQNAW
jgi:cyclin C